MVLDNVDMTTMEEGEESVIHPNDTLNQQNDSTSFFVCFLLYITHLIFCFFVAINSEDIRSNGEEEENKEE